MLYLLGKQIMKMLLTIFFNEVQTVGQHLTPSTGPLIVCGNHSNQFIDPMMIITHCSRETAFLAADSSLKRKVIGFFGRMFGAIPVKRPQDHAIKGRGTLTWERNHKRVIGTNSQFLVDVKPGDTIKTKAGNFVVVAVESNTVLEAKPGKEHVLETLDSSTFTVIPKMDHSEAFEHVQQALSKGQCVGIFPEGGSHDRTTLLPLKAGVCLMALGTMARFNVSVTIQCIGLNYFKCHKFRSRAIVNFGVPYKVPWNLAELFLKDRESAVNCLLADIKQRLQDVWITAPSYEELTSIFLARRIFKPDDMNRDPALDTEMNVKFAKAYNKLQARGLNSEIQQVMKDIQIYYQKLKRFGVHDYQVKTYTQEWRAYKNLWTLLVGLLTVVMGFPAWLFTKVLGIIVSVISEKEREKALEGSSVKIYGYDVLASVKVVYGLVGFIALSIAVAILSFIYIWGSYGFAIAFNDVCIFAVVWPIYYYLFVDLADRSIDALIRLYMRLFSIFSPRLLNKLRDERRELKKKIYELVEKYGPTFYPDLDTESLFMKNPESGNRIFEKGYQVFRHALI